MTDYQKAQDLLIKAINEKRTLKICHEDHDFDIDFEPYIMGHDPMQESFVWGYIPFRRIYYKYYFAFIKSVKLTNQHFTPQPNLNYYFADGEEHFGLLDNIDQWENFGYHPQA